MQEAKGAEASICKDMDSNFMGEYCILLSLSLRRMELPFLCIRTHARIDVGLAFCFFSLSNISFLRIDVDRSPISIFMSSCCCILASTRFVADFLVS